MKLNWIRLLAAAELFVVANFIHVPSAHAESNGRENAWIIAEKPSALLMATGGGFEIGRELSDSSTLALNAELDHILVGGTSFLGLTWRQKIYNGFYFQGGVGGH